MMVGGAAAIGVGAAALECTRNANAVVLVGTRQAVNQKHSRSQTPVVYRHKQRMHPFPRLMPPPPPNPPQASNRPPVIPHATPTPTPAPHQPAAIRPDRAPWHHLACALGGRMSSTTALATKSDRRSWGCVRGWVGLGLRLVWGLRCVRGWLGLVWG